MAHFAKFVSMAMSPEKAKETVGGSVPVAAPSPPPAPLYPYGLCLSLADEELAKLDLDPDCEVGDTIHLCCLAKVTECSSRDTSDGPKRRIELQITDLAIEDESTEMPPAMSREERIGRRYSKPEDA